MKIPSNWVAVGAASLTGLLYVLAYPGVGAWPVAFIALVPLLLALEGKSPSQALLLGWVAGLVQTGVGFRWLLPVLERFSGFSPLAAGLILLLLTVYQALRLGLGCWLAARATARGWPPTWNFATGFVASETVFPLIFPWYFGAALHEILPLIQIAEVGSVVAVSLLLVAINLGAARTLRALCLRERRPFSGLVTAACMLLAAWAYGEARCRAVSADAPSARPLTVGVVQANLDVLAKRAPVPDTVGRHIALSAPLLEARPLDLLIWSESSEARVVPESEVGEHFRRVLAPLSGVPTLLGAVLSGPVEGAGLAGGAPDVAGRRTLFNSALLFGAQGALIGRYDKQHLLPFAEYLPLGARFPRLYDLSPRSGRFSAGHTEVALELSGHRLAATICYEDILPRAVNRLVRSSGAELLINLSNDAWFHGGPGPVIHLALAKFRAIEQRRYLVRANNSGVSSVVAPTGNVKISTAPFTEAAFRSEVYWLTDRTPYQRLGDAPAWLLTLLVTAGAFWRRPAAPRLRKFGREAQPE